MNKSSLEELCKKLKVASSGTKAEIIDRIIPKLAHVSTPERKARDKWLKSIWI